MTRGDNGEQEDLMSEGFHSTGSAGGEPQPFPDAAHPEGSPTKEGALLMGAQVPSRRTRRARTWRTQTCRPQKDWPWPEGSSREPSTSRAGTLTVPRRERGPTLALVPLRPLQVRPLFKEVRANEDPRLELAAMC
ncbi:hypothetical protein PF008_g24306 [Phytophthora fragariae]|uniref:Uncharacterized protein n=1 Tax=Phytophthora fragariae TaxID=53985 RepID=A0A6G0QNX2_9STRA|nr:hypothetical protein PF008_g24306 [Phytophthora fragariae]